MPKSSQALELETAAAKLVRKLGGTWRPGGGMCHCPAHDDVRPSLSVRVGERSLLFKCFAGCTGVEVIQAVRGRRFSIPKLACRPISKCASDPSSPMVRHALAIWEAAQSLAGTAGEQYLISRGIAGAWDALRFHPRTPLGSGPGVRFRPAVIAAICDRSRLVAIQRIFLDRTKPSLAFDLANPKLMLGRPLMGAVRLGRPTSILGLAEGLETALSATLLLGIPVWATLGNERLARIAIPDRIKRLILLPDADRAGRLGASRARQAYAREGRRIETLYPWRGHNDWNDVLLEEGEEVGPPVRFAA